MRKLSNGFYILKDYAAYR